MRLAHTVEARQQQTQRIDPRQILASEILAWTTSELEAAVERELAENPALEARDGAAVWNRGDSLPVTEASPVTGTSALSSQSYNSLRNDNDNGSERGVASLSAMGGEGWEDDPLERVAFSRSLRDYLRDQVGQVSDDETVDIVRYLIEWVDERGYLTADSAEVAERFRVTPSCVDRSIRALQSMDPSGVGSRDLRECLKIQVDYLEQTGEAHPLAKRVLHSCWDDLVAHREERIASRLRTTLTEVRNALKFLRHALTPYPGAAFRASWTGKSGTPAGNADAMAAVRPDIVFHRTEAGFAVEITRDFEDAITIAPLWKKLVERGDAGSDESMRRYIKEHVERAQTFLNGVSRRGRTLRLIAHTLAHVQQGFLETGNRAFLRPLTRQTLAEELELDESVVSRAVAEKWAQLPGGELVPLDAFFGNAHAVREALVTLIAGEDPNNPYSDDEIADALTAQGFPLARRTVAKYRGLEKILPARLRRRGAESEPDEIAYVAA
jgi:RNA polymerase sigma-54 factor